MTVFCVYGGEPINPHDEGVYKKVSGWVTGPKADSMILREDVGEYACRTCINRLKLGQAADQPDLFGTS